ncbi:MAG: hypothetical protein ACK5PS_03730 [Desulfopila sp.]
MRAIILPLAAAACCLLLASGCARQQSSDLEPLKGSLTKTYKLIDETGRESGTLVLQPMGKAELRDSDGKLIGVFSAE